MGGADTMLGALAFSSDGRTLVTGGHDGVIRVWQLATLDTSAL
ncbi:MAG: hypothetical protein ACR2M0_11330 [Chloroflexia bacterium]